jgi:putative peptidoglycan lipid II flippase
VPFFYAFNDSKLPMKISIITVGVNLALYYPLIKMLDFAGLAAATSVAGILNFLLLAKFLPSKGIAIPYARILVDVVRMIVAAVLAFYCARLLPISFAIGDSPFLQRLQDLLVLLVAGGILYLLFCLIFRVREVWRVPRLLLRK